MNQKVRMIMMLLAISVSIIKPSFAGVTGTLTKAWERSGGSGVVTAGHLYQGQRGGHYTGGSACLMRENRSEQLLKFNAPEFEWADPCDDVFLNMGGFSWGNLDGVKEKVKSIVKNSGLNFAYIGLSAISPVIGETVQEVFSKLQELSGFLGGSCRDEIKIGAAAGNFVLQHSAAAKNLYNKVLGNTNQESDLAAIYSKYPKNKKNVLQEAAEKDESLIIEDINLAWAALDKLKIEDEETKRLMMTISGTIIIKAGEKDNSPPRVKYIAAKVLNSDILKGLLRGGKSMTLLRCEEKKKCLRVTEEVADVSATESFEAKVEKYFTAFEKALKQDEELDSDSQKFLLKSGLPIYKLFDVIFQHTAGNPKFEQGAIVKLVAWKILYNYLNEMLKQVNEATNNLQISSATQLADFKRAIEENRQLLSNFELKNLTRATLENNFIKRSEWLEETMAKETTQRLSSTYKGGWT